MREPILVGVARTSPSACMGILRKQRKLLSQHEGRDGLIERFGVDHPPPGQSSELVTVDSGTLP